LCRVGFPGGRPSHRAALRVGVDQQHPAAGLGADRSEVGGDGRFADPSFLVEHPDDHADAFLDLHISGFTIFRKAASVGLRFHTSTTLPTVG
jgi:hypothetical protein